MRLYDSAIGKTVTTRPKRFRALSSRVGVFPYLINDKLVWQYRPEEEVFNDESIESFLDAVITIGHPENDDDLSESHGSVYDVESITEENEDIEPGLYCDFLVFTDEAYKLASSGVDVSPSYNAVLYDSPGEYNGKKYDLIQKNIRYKSLGLVKSGRQEKTKVYFQLSKDGNIFVNNNIIEVPIVKTKADLNIIEPLKPILPIQEEIKNNDESEVIEESTIETSSEQSETLETPETPETTEEPVKDSAVVINSEGGVNINRDYLDDVIEIARRAETLGLFGFNEAVQYALSSRNTMMRMILLKEGIEICEWADIESAYEVYEKLRPMPETESSSTTPAMMSDSREPSLPIIPKIDHPLHQKPASLNKGYQTVKVVTFDDLE